MTTENSNILFDTRHSARFSFTMAKDGVEKVRKAFEAKGFTVEPTGVGADEYGVEIPETDYVRFKLMMADAVDCISANVGGESHGKFRYTVGLPSVVATKLEFALNYGHVGENTVKTAEAYIEAMGVGASGDKYEYGWNGVAPLSLGNDTVLTNCAIDRLVYPHHIIDMREYNNRKVTLVCGYSPKWTALSALMDFFASYSAGCAGRKIDAGAYMALNSVKSRFNAVNAGFTDYASFRKLGEKKFSVSMDMETEPSYIEAFFSMIKPDLFRIYNLFSQCSPLNGGHIHVNYDTDEGRWQVKNIKTPPFGLDDVHGLDIVDGELMDTYLGECNLMGCTLKGCTLDGGSLIGYSEAEGCRLNGCYCGMDTCLTGCHVESNNTLDGVVKRSNVDDNNSYTDNARFVASKNKNNRKI